jgi:hypothetical protein
LKSLSLLRQLQFYIGFIGALALMPVLYGIQAIWGGFDHSESYIWLDIIMTFIVPLLSGVSFALTGLVAFPVLKCLQRRDIVRDIL